MHGIYNIDGNALPGVIDETKTVGEVLGGRLGFRRNSMKLSLILLPCALFILSGCATSQDAASAAAMHSPSEATCVAMPSSLACLEWRTMNAGGP